MEDLMQCQTGIIIAVYNLPSCYDNLKYYK
jgi:hypothetical protein